MSPGAADQKDALPRMMRLGMWFAAAFAIAFPLLLVLVLLSVLPPTIGGESKALRKVHGATKDGPVLVLPDGWEPHWTYCELGAAK